MRLTALSSLAIAVLLAGCQYKGIASPTLSTKDAEWMALVPNFEHHVTELPWDMPDPTGEKPGTIVVDTSDRKLYFVQPGGRAIRYAVAVGNEAFGWTGTATVQRKAEWPHWTPPAEMLVRWPHLRGRAGGMSGGPENPLGARALYLYQNGHDTLYRIHGTNEPNTIGQAASSGCIRMRNIDVVDLYNRVGTNAKVIVR
jgi:lipoprotein-anchoring transpeptidase ErfK/SrfK